MSIPSSARFTDPRSRAPRSATPAFAAITRFSPPAPTPARSCTSACAKARRTPQRDAALRRRTVARVARAGATGPNCYGPTRGSGNKKVIARSSRPAGSTRSASAMQPAVRAGIARSPRAPGRRCRTTPPTGIAQIAETITRRPAARRSPRPHSRSPSRALAHWGHYAFVDQPHRPARKSSSPNTASTPSSSSRSATSKTKPSRTSHPASSPPTPPGRSSPAWPTTCCAGPAPRRCPATTIRAARTLRRRLLALPGRLTRTARRWTLHLPARWPWRDAFTEALARIRALPTARLSPANTPCHNHARSGRAQHCPTTTRAPPQPARRH